MPKLEISWKERTPEGRKREINVRYVGGEWRFFCREKRFDRWERLREPTVEDWQVLLDGVRRRIQRRLIRPEEETRILTWIQQRYAAMEK